MTKSPSIVNISSGYASNTQLNSNFNKLTEAFNNTLSLDGSTPNAMRADLDLNSNDVFNVGSISAKSIIIDGLAFYPSEPQIATSYAAQTYTGDGTTFTYSMGFNPLVKANVYVFINGIYQNQDTFSISGSNITFTEAPPLDSTLEIKVPINVTSIVNTSSSDLVYDQGDTNSIVRSIESKLREVISVKDFGAVGDGVTNDTADISAAVTASANETLDFESGEYAITSGTLAAGGSIVGDGANTTTIRRTGTGNLINAANRSGDRISGLTLDLDRTALGNVPGHGISASGNGLVFQDIVVKDYGSDGVGGGTGILVIPGTSFPFPENIRMVDCDFRPDPGATISVGWLYDGVAYSFASRIYSDNVVGGIGYAHELKDNSRYNSLAQLIASDSNVALAYGQTTAGVDGADYNVATNIVAAKCDQGLLIGEGFGNVTVGMVHVTTGSPANDPLRGVSFTGGAQQNYAGSVVTLGSMDESVYISGDRNTVEIVAHDTAPVVAEFTASSDKNFVNVVHSGTRTSVRGNITDNSGFAINSAQANVVHSPLTGERIGSVQGKFWDKLGEAGITPPASHGWVYESDQFNFQSLLTQGNTGDISGISVSTGRDGQNEGRLWHVTRATQAENYWSFAVGGATDVIQIHNDGIRVGGLGGPRWLHGSGSPEGVVSAPVGSFFSRTNGGAGTTFYVKESGTGNTGWVAK